jgi:hypothetical protein
MVRFALSLAWAYLIAGCSGDRDRLAGSGSVTTNGVKGTVTRDGLPASGIRVSLYSADHDPDRDGGLPDSLKRLTDRSGGYRFENLAPGSYKVIAAREDEDEASLIAVAVAAGDSVLSLPDAALLPMGSLHVGLPEDNREIGAHVYLPGTGNSAGIDSAASLRGFLLLSGVPAATYAAVLYAAPGADSARSVLATALAVPPEGEGTTYPYARWSSGYTVAINTSPSGADVAGDLAGFPLLVRLTAANFDFSRAKPDGSDLRLTASDSATVLPFEIETWDPVNRAADLWVRVDTVHGGDASGFLCLFSGNGAAIASPVQSPVFDTAQGFAGVWHLGESPAKSGARDPVIRDRTANGYHGIPDGAMAAEASVPGIVGKGLLFDGKDDHVELAASRLFLTRNEQPLTLSAWIRPGPDPAKVDSVGRRLLSFKTDTVGLSTLAWGLGSNGRISHYSRTGDSVYTWPAAAAAESVYHVALTYAEGEYRGYVNGRLDFTVTGAGLEAGGLQPLLLGAHLTGNRNFQGLVDELRIEKSQRTQDWITLSHATQRPGSAVVKVEAFKR